MVKEQNRLTRDQRWRIAGQMQDFYNSTFNTNLSKREFYKTENPLTRRLVRYDVTYYFNISGNSKKMGGSYEFYMPQETISYYAFNDLENESTINERVKSQHSDIFKGKAKNLVYNNMVVQVTPRGVENGEINYKDIDVKEVETDITSNKSFTKKVEIVSKKRGTTNKNYYNLNIWL